MNTVSFHEPVMLTWPAQSYWYPFLMELHVELGRSLRLHYDDKDILVPSHFRWKADGDYYARLEGFDVAIMRFNERGQRGYENEARLGPKYRITVMWCDHNRVGGFGFEWVDGNE